MAERLDPFDLQSAPFRDVDDQAPQALAGRRTEARPLSDVPQPRLVAVLGLEAVLHVEPLALGRLRPRLHDPIAVLRVDVTEPRVRVVDPGARRVSEQTFDRVGDRGEPAGLDRRLPDDRVGVAEHVQDAPEPTSRGE